LLIGKGYSSGYYFNGTIDEVRIYNRALREDEIKQLYYRGLKTHYSRIDYSYPDIDNHAVLLLNFDQGISNGSANNETVYDMSVYGNDGTVYGANWTVGRVGQALSFDGDGDYVDCGKDESLDMGSGDFTITAWIKLTADGINTIAGKKGSNYGKSPGYMLTVDDGVLKFTMGDGSNSFISSGFAGVNDGQWHFVAGIRNGNTAYVILDEQSKSDDCSAIGNVNNDRNFYVGQKGYIGNYFNGTIDEVRIYNRALSEEEIKQLYKLTNKVHNLTAVVVDKAGNKGSTTNKFSVRAVQTSIDYVFYSAIGSFAAVYIIYRLKRRRRGRRRR